MPMYDYLCEQQHHDERFFWRADQAQEVLPCRFCEGTATRQLSLGSGLCYFEEGRARVIENMCHDPVTVRSLSEHNRLMKKHKVAQAGPGRGMPGSWI